MFLIIINKLACEEDDDDWKASGTRGWCLNPSGLGMSEHNSYSEGHLWPDIVHSRTAEQALTHPWVRLCHSWSLTTKPGDKANNNCQTTLFISKVFLVVCFVFQIIAHDRYRRNHKSLKHANGLCSSTNWATYFPDGHKRKGVNAWPLSQSAFFSCFPALQCWPFKLLQSVISHAPNFAESLGSTCFCNLHPAGLPIGFGLHTSAGWLAASPTNQFLCTGGIS